MKKLFALLALVLGVVSCMKDQSFEAGLAGDGNFVLSVALPSDATRAAGSDSALGAIDNGVLAEYNVRYTLEVYDANGNLAKEDQKIINETSTSFELRLIPGRDYRFVVWADFVKEGVEPYYNVEDLRNVTLTGTHNAMNESRDAYTEVVEIKEFNSASTIKMELTRPFAKLRVVTNDMDELYTTLQSATVKYTTPIYTTFNALTETAGNLEANVTKSVNFTEDAYLYAGEPKNDEEQTLFADYIFGTENGVITFTLDVTDNVEDLPKVTFNTNIPVQRNHLTTIYGPVLTDANEVSVEIKDAFDEPENIVTYPIEDAETLAKVLTSNEKHINATLGRDIDLPISSLGTQTPGSGEYKLGGEATETINIDLNGHKLNITTTYWSALGAKNENALFTIKNGTMTSSQATGTWNSYDLTFANCNYVFEDVVFDKAIALSNVGEAVTRAEATIARKSVTMKNVTINETHDYYAMWITAEGQTVNIEGLTINSLGRGIKIDEQYVSAPAKVTLNIKDATFKTAKKAAIVVKSVAGADITLSNVDIADVAADTANAVWVDEDASAYFDKVNVVGGSMAIEGENTIEGENAQATFADAVKEANAVVQLAAGEYAIPANIAEGVTIICQQGTVFNNPSKMNLNGATVIGAKFNSDNGSIVNSGQVNGTFKNCVFEGKNVFRYGYVGKTCVFEDCHFKENGNEWVFHFDGVGTGVTNAEIVCRRCTFDGKRVAIAGAVNNLVMEDCEFINGSYLNTYCNATFTGTKFNTSIRPLGAHAIYNNCEYYGNALKFENLSLYSGYDCKITVDDVDYAIASSVANLENYVNNATRDINVYITKTLTSKDATLKQKENVNVYITSYGDKKSFSAATLYIHGGSRSDGAETMTFENIHFSSFATRDLISSNSTASAERYAHNLTFKNCSFEGDNGIDVVGLRLRQTYNITIENCETRNLHSLGQLTSTYGLTVKNTTVNAFRGFNLLTTAVNTVFDGVAIDATKEDGYGIRVDAAAGGDVTIKNSTIIAYEPLVLRNAQAGFVLNMENNNTITANGEYQLVINGETPTLNGADDLTKNI
ncbi:MAG: hypothetical protein IKV06_00745 [Alistipes sp.]|nr:hypothetical protein [Alistipes sp.]